MKSRIIELATWLPWSAPVRVKTLNGERILRTAPLPDNWWTDWKANKEAFRAEGISCRKNRSGAWEVCWWSALDGSVHRTEAALRVNAVKESKAADAPAVDLPRPEGREYLAYQKAGIVYALGCLGAGRGCLIGDEMGLGKTIQAIGVINCRPDIKKVLVICPNTLKLNWARELARWLVRPLKVAVAMAGQPWPAHADVILVNFDILSRFKAEISAVAWDLRIVDEAHYIKNPKAARTKNTLAIRSRFKISLTGTPIENRPIELFPVISDLDPDAWDSYFRFAQRYCGAYRGQWGWEFGGCSNADELQYKLRSTILVRRLKADVLTELPPKRRQVIELDASNCRALLSIEEAEAKLAEEQLIELRTRVELAKAGESREEYDAAVKALRHGHGVAFEQMAKVRHSVAIAKLPQVVAFVTDALENGKVIIFAHHLDVVAMLKDTFRCAAVITGEVPGDQRQAEVDRFQNDPDCRVFIGNNAAAEGITLTAASHVVFAELDWVPGKLSQKEDRAHRIGQKDCVLCSYLVLEGSLDARMAQVNIKKLNVIDLCLDRDTAFAEADVADVDVTGKVTISFDEVAKQAKTVSAEAAERALYGLRRLAAVCDGARKSDDQGFNGRDVRLGHALARLEVLSPKQAVLACRLCLFYKKQLGADFIARLQAAMQKKI